MTLRERNTLKMVAEHWAISTTTVRRLIDNGNLGAIRLGGLFRITREQVLECETICDTKLQRAREKEHVDVIRCTIRDSAFRRGQLIAGKQLKDAPLKAKK